MPCDILVKKLPDTWKIGQFGAFGFLGHFCWILGKIKSQETPKWIFFTN
jgi:hypothetical protein